MRIVAPGGSSPIHPPLGESVLLSSKNIKAIGPLRNVLTGLFTQIHKKPLPVKELGDSQRIWLVFFS